MVQTPTLESQIRWELLPKDFILPDEPVDNINQPSLAAALTESLVNADKLTPESLTTTNYGICVKLEQQFVVKAPDWAYISRIAVPKTEIERSYTPQIQGDIPAIVMEFLSEAEGGEYSIKPNHPYGKWFFYEKILKAPYYVLFEIQSAHLEVYQLEKGVYKRQNPDETGRYWLEPLQLYLGVWDGVREGRQKSWLRWWTEQGELLPWGAELVQELAIERQRTEAERQRTEIERQRAERLADLLRAQGIDPDRL